MRRTRPLLCASLAMLMWGVASAQPAGPARGRPSFATVYQASMSAAVAARLSTLFHRIRDTEIALRPGRAETLADTLDRWDARELPALADMLRLVRFARLHDARIMRWAARRMRSGEPLPKDARDRAASPGGWPSAWYGPLLVGSLDLPSIQNALGVVPPRWDSNAALAACFVEWAGLDEPVLGALGLDASRLGQASSEVRLTSFFHIYRRLSQDGDQAASFDALAATCADLIPASSSPAERRARLDAFLTRELDHELVDRLGRTALETHHRGRYRFGVLRTCDCPRAPTSLLGAVLDRSFFLRHVEASRSPVSFEDFYHHVKLPTFAAATSELARAAELGRSWKRHAALLGVMGRAFPPISPFILDRLTPAAKREPVRFAFLRSPTGRVAAGGLEHGPLGPCTSAYRAVARRAVADPSLADPVDAAFGGVLLLQMKEVSPMTEALEIPATGFQGYVDLVGALGPRRR